MRDSFARLGRGLSYRVWAVAFTVFVCCLIVAGVALAIPDSNGVINGCYQKNAGNLRVVNSAASCRNDEIPISWNVQGQTGPSNAFSKDQQSSFASTLLNGTFTNIVTLSLPAGNYVVNATAALTGGVSFNTAQCSIRGSSGPLSGSIQTTVGGVANSFGAIPLTTGFTLLSPDNVSLACRASGDTISTQPSTITAIQVGALTTQ